MGNLQPTCHKQPTNNSWAARQAPRGKILIGMSIIPLLGLWVWPVANITTLFRSTVIKRCPPPTVLECRYRCEMMMTSIKLRDIKLIYLFIHSFIHLFIYLFINLQFFNRSNELNYQLEFLKVQRTLMWYAFAVHVMQSFSICQNIGKYVIRVNIPSHPVKINKICK